ncbi:hypothetical protein M0811_14155 [Anaeramoeba ignava]|uniref:Fibronectin type-III domain-containing protein n=1 Tax=Anaeramoeba ignava TaxID=1746090 RepID=A0A9Q0LZ91_ANAIG|nr:hypothetical protein M0811_14155 [Anaeramoeba ignava]
MKTILLIVLIIQVILIESIQSEQLITTRHYSSGEENYAWNLISTFSELSAYYGSSVSVKGNVLAIGDAGLSQTSIYRYSGTNFNLEQTLDGPSSSSFGYSVSVSENGTILAVGALNSDQAFIYRYNGTIWNQEVILNGTVNSRFGSSISVSEEVLVVGAQDPSQGLIYIFNGTDWNYELFLNGSSGSESSVSVSGNQTRNAIVVGSSAANQVVVFRYDGASFNFEDALSGSSGFGSSVSVSENGTLLAVGASNAKQAFIYRYNGTWNQEQILNGSTPSFGSSVSIYGNVLVIGAYSADQAFIYRYNGTIWNQEQTLDGSSSGFGHSVSIYENFTAVGAPDSSQAFVYEFMQIPQVNILNCSSLFSSFDCYWDQIELANLKYQINYGFGWIGIESPILEDGNVYYQLFNSSIYDNITGNEFYSIQIKACDVSSTKCGESSSFINLTTKIDSVKDFQLTNANSSICVTWNPPNVQINLGIAHLDHYNLSHFNESQPDSISFVSLVNSSFFYFLTHVECENYYNISIWGCRTLECEGNDKGEVANSLISLLFGEVGNLACSISNLIDINCNWNQLINCSTPSYYNFTYQSISQNDSGNYQPISSNQQFTAQFTNQEYQINVSACNSDGKCGYISSISITTDNLAAPIIYETISKIEEIEFNFTKLTNANNYSISLDNGTNWQKFTSLDLSGNEIIGIISGIPGNVEYNISIRGCADLNCETPYLGEPSSIISTRAKLGNITSLNCISLINGFICTWHPLILSEGLKAYSFTYNSISICLSDSLAAHYLLTGLNGGEYYEISIYSSADLNCSFNEYSGINSTTSVTTSSPN